DQIDDAAIPVEARAEVEDEVAADHAHEAFGGGAVEAVLALQLTDQLGIDAAGAAVLLRDVASRPGRPARAAAGLAAAGPADPRRRLDGVPAEAGDHQVHGPARRCLDHDE